MIATVAALAVGTLICWCWLQRGNDWDRAHAVPLTIAGTAVPASFVLATTLAWGWVWP